MVDTSRRMLCYISPATLNHRFVTALLNHSCCLTTLLQLPCLPSREGRKKQKLKKGINSKGEQTLGYLGVVKPVTPGEDVPLRGTSREGGAHLGTSASDFETVKFFSPMEEETAIGKSSMSAEGFGIYVQQKGAYILPAYVQADGTATMSHNQGWQPRLWVFPASAPYHGAEPDPIRSSHPGDSDHLTHAPRVTLPDPL
ncbi:hypothetical protein AVEN_226739-1 [Araneus ventricosus]|uniref:Uncharacterized protein n=1 Tax=Araneus ventricosus TaxID=182803 RepID=A0A4Y2WA97_ARAVE|nr:hypothetical protein AVEN_226739-1 [Araneus ventricosus]